MKGGTGRDGTLVVGALFALTVCALLLAEGPVPSSVLSGTASVRPPATDGHPALVVGPAQARWPSTTSPLPLGPSASPPNLTLSGYTHQTISSSMTVANITIGGNASLAVVGKTTVLTVQGNILIESNGTLYENGSLMTVDCIFTNEYSVTLLQDGRWLVQRSTVTSNGWQIFGFFDGDSNISVNGSMFFAGQNWIAANLGWSSNFTVTNTTIGSDVNLLINPANPDEATVRFVNSSGFNIWPNFMAGMTANLTLPKTDPANHGLTWTNWSFPAGAQETGVHYRIILVNDRLWRIGPHLWNGADVTVQNTDNCQLGFFVEKSEDAFSGFFFQHYWTLAYVTPQFDLHLRNVTVFSWGWFPYSADLYVNDSDIGQVMANDLSLVHLNDDNYTGITGALGVSQEAQLSVANSSIAALLSGEGTGSIVATNDSITQGPLNMGPVSVQANELSQITLVNTTVQAGQQLQAQQSGKIVVDETLSVRETDEHGVASGASNAVSWSSNSSLASAETSDAAGFANFTLRELTVTDAGTVTTDGYTLQALAGDDLGTLALTLTGRVRTALWLHPMITGTWPAAGATGVSVATSVSIDFGQPMAAASTSAAVSLAPATLGPGVWNGNTTNLTYSVQLATGTLYTIEVGTGAVTLGGISLPADFTSTFTTAGTPPSLTGVTVAPSSGTVDIGAVLTLTASPACGTGPCPPGTTYAWSAANANGALNVSTGTVVGVKGVEAGTDAIFVNATLDGLTDMSAEVTVTVESTSSPPSLASIALSPPSASLTGREVQVFAAALTCAGGACPSGVVLTWSLTNGDATLNASSGMSVRLTAGTTSGSVGLFVNASLNGVVQEASEIVEIHATSSSPPTTGGSLGAQELTLGILLAIGIAAVVGGVLLGVRRQRNKPGPVSAAPVPSSAETAPAPPTEPPESGPPPA